MKVQHRSAKENSHRPFPPRRCPFMERKSQFLRCKARRSTATGSPFSLGSLLVENLRSLDPRNPDLPLEMDSRAAEKPDMAGEIGGIESSYKCK